MRTRTVHVAFPHVAFPRVHECCLSCTVTHATDVPIRLMQHGLVFRTVYACAWAYCLCSHARTPASARCTALVVSIVPPRMIQLSLPRMDISHSDPQCETQTSAPSRVTPRDPSAITSRPRHPFAPPSKTVSSSLPWRCGPSSPLVPPVGPPHHWCPLCALLTTGAPCGSSSPLVPPVGPPHHWCPLWALLTTGAPCGPSSPLLPPVGPPHHWHPLWALLTTGAPCGPASPLAPPVGPPHHWRPMWALLTTGAPCGPSSPLTPSVGPPHH